MAKDDPLREDLESQLEQLRAALKDPRNPGARLDSAMAKMRKTKAKVEKCQEQLRQAEASLKAAHAEEEEANSELKAAQENAVPKSELPPGDAAMQLLSDDITDLTDMLKQCGLLAVAACEGRLRGASKKGQSGTLRQPPQNSPGDCEVGEPSSRCETRKQRAHSAGCGEEWWGWILGGDTTWGSRGPPRALPTPPPPNPAAPVTPLTPQNPARRARTQRNHEGRRNPKPAQCTDAGLVPPRELAC